MLSAKIVSIETSRLTDGRLSDRGVIEAGRNVVLQFTVRNDARENLALNRRSYWTIAHSAQLPETMSQPLRNALQPYENNMRCNK